MFLGRAIGFLASAFTASLWLVFLFPAPATDCDTTIRGATTATFFVVVLMVALATLGLLAAWKASPYLMLAVFALSFFPMGLYLLGTPGIYRWIGVFDFLFLASGVPASASAPSTNTSRPCAPATIPGRPRPGQRIP